jgi:hypothetical protein
MKKLIIMTAVLIGLSTSAQANGAYQTKVDMFAMIGEKLKMKMEFFLMDPTMAGADEILALYPKYRESMNELTTPDLRSCKKDDACNHYLELGMANMDSIEYLQPKVISTMEGWKN